MKSAWDKIFSSDTLHDLTEQEREAALRELALAVSNVERTQASPEHNRILKRIASELDGKAAQAD